MDLYTVGYDFEPEDEVWYADLEDQSVKHGVCSQVTIKIYSELPVTHINYELIEDIYYWILLDEQQGNIKVRIEQIFHTYEEAAEYLFDEYITNTPTPTPTVTPTPSGV